ncbi:MAG: hypothetical protein MZV65_47750 [Chromatiales bacterium]|nr:hypothetical protein [Chromatiales bacterium]MCK7582526.1 hypothetical protein [Chromatiales bacterium]
MCYLGNAMLSLLTKIASGYWHIADSQSGYTAIGRRALKAIDWDQMYKRYGQPNDLLVRLNIAEMRVTDVPIRPVYGVGEKSGIRPLRMIPKLSWLITRLFFYRLLHKYIIQDFHPLLFLRASFFTIATWNAVWAISYWVAAICGTNCRNQRFIRCFFDDYGPAIFIVRHVV